MPSDDILPRLWSRAAKTHDPGDKKLLLEAANLIKDFRDMFSDVEDLDPETAYRLGVRIKAPKGGEDAGA